MLGVIGRRPVIATLRADRICRASQPRRSWVCNKSRQRGTKTEQLQTTALPDEHPKRALVAAWGNRPAWLSRGGHSYHARRSPSPGYERCGGPATQSSCPSARIESFRDRPVRAGRPSETTSAELLISIDNGRSSDRLQSNQYARRLALYAAQAVEIPTSVLARAEINQIEDRSLIRIHENLIATLMTAVWLDQSDATN